MAVRIAQYTTWAPDEIELPSGAVYCCRQISAGGMDLLDRVTSADDHGVTRDELVAEVVALLRAPVAEIAACSVEELVAILVTSAMPAGKLPDTPVPVAPMRTPAQAKPSPAPCKARRRATPKP